MFLFMEYLFLILGIVAISIFFFKRNMKEKMMTNKNKNYTIDDQYNAQKREKEKEIDQLLSKMGKNGIADLSEKDRKRLEELSK